MRFLRCSGHSGVIEMIVEQLGLAMMPLCCRTACGLISGTTSGTSAAMRNADELSTTTAPARAAIGAKRFEIAPPAENSAMWTPPKLSSVSSRTSSAFPRKRSVFPADRAEANRRSSARGKPRRSRHSVNSTPTAPVAPTMATTGGDELPDFIFNLHIQRGPGGERRGLWDSLGA